MRTLVISLLGLALLAAGAAHADDVRVVVGLKGGGRVVAHVSPQAIASLRADADVAFVEEDVIFEITGPKADKPGKPSGGGDTSTPPPSESLPWGVDRVNAPLTGTTGAGVTVAVVDTGIDLTHPDLESNIIGGALFARSKSYADDNGHGTHVAGTIAAVDNDEGVVGVAPRAWLLAVKVLDRNGSGWSSDVADGIEWAADNHADIINLSLGSRIEATIVTTACNYATDAGVLIVAAAGNDGDGDLTTDEDHYPSMLEVCVSVGATTNTSEDLLASFSSTNDQVDLCAPGVGIPSTWKGGGYRTISGTSMATPHAAGMAALIWQDLASKASSGQTNRAAVLNALLQATRDRGPTGVDNGYGHGIIDWDLYASN